MEILGYSIIIESPKGSTRNGKDPFGQGWFSVMTCDYGCITNTMSTDGDNLDCFVGPDLDSDKIFVITQNEPYSFGKPNAIIDSKEYADPANEGWPIDTEKHIHAALSYYNAGKGKSNHSEEEWQSIGHKIAAAATKQYGKKHELSNGKINNTEDTAKTDSYSEPAIDEYKVVFGCKTQSQAVDLYKSNYDEYFLKDSKIFGGCKEYTAESFKSWLMDNGFTDRDYATDSMFSDIAIVCGQDDVQLISDSNGILKVRQLGTIVDAVNGNKRIYPKKVWVKAWMDALQRAKAGAMLGELVHPDEAKLKEKGPYHVNKKGTPRYVDNPERKVTRIDDIEAPDKNGKVYITHSLLNTESGRLAADQYRSGKPPGVSTRFKMETESRVVDSQPVDVALWLYIDTWDIVENPAVYQTKTDFQLLSDSQIEQLTGQSSPNEGEQGRQKYMKDKLNRSIQKIYSLMVAKAALSQIQDARRLAGDCLAEAEASGEDITESAAKILRADEMIQGYSSDKPDIEGTEGKDLGSGPDGVFPAKEMQDQASNYPKEPRKDPSAGLDATQAAALKEITEERAKAKADAERKAAIDTAVESQREILSALEQDEQDFILGNVRTLAANVDAVPQVLADQIERYSILASKRVLKTDGTGKAAGSAEDPASRGNQTTAKDRAPAYMEKVNRILAEADAYAMRTSPGFNPATKKKLREKNMERFIDPVLNELAQRKTFENPETWFNATDALVSRGEQALSDAIMGDMEAKSDSTTTANIINQPTIQTALMIQSFQDLTALPLVDGIGPGLNRNNGQGGWQTGADGRIGTEVRIPVEYYDYADMSGWANKPARQYDPFLAVPEGAGIDEAIIKTRWLSFYAVWKRIAAAPTRDVIKALGNGPFNYPVVARLLYHATADKNRRVDVGLYNEMAATADEYQCVTVTAEAQNLANNSVFNGGGSQVVNLNPTKTAIAAVAAGDANITYGVNVVAAVRLKSGSGGAASPYTGPTKLLSGATCLELGPVPIVRPRQKIAMDDGGNVTFSTSFAVANTTPGGLVLGYCDDTNQVATFAGGGATANYAVDYVNGVVIFTAGAGLAGAAGILTSAVSMTYSYATNYSEFQVYNLSTATLTLEAQYNGLLAQFDADAALMGSTPRFKFPNCVITSLIGSQPITRASIFYKFNSPDGTELYPSSGMEGAYFDRNGLCGYRHNSPWLIGDNSALYVVHGSTKYALDVPAEIRGPYPKFEQSTGKIVSAEQYAIEENSAIFTPQVTDTSGNILNPVSRRLLYR